MIRILLIVIGLLLILLTGLIGTTTGLQAGIWLAGQLLPGQLQVTAAEGRLADRFALHGLHYRDDTSEFEIDNIAVDWRSLALLRRTVLIDNLQIDTLRVTTRRDGPPATIEPFSLPLDVEIRGLDISTLDYHDLDTDTRLQFRQLHTRVSAHDDRIAVRQLTVSGDHFIADMHGHVQLIENWPLQLNLRYSLTLPDIPPSLADVDGHGEITGNMQTLTIDHWTTTPLRSELKTTVTDILDTPAWHGRLRATAVDLQAFTDIAGHTDIDIEFDGNLSETTLSAAAVLEGEVQGDWKLTASLAHETLDRIEISSLRFKDHGRQFDLIGHGRLALADQTELDFTGEWRYRTEEPVTGKLHLTGIPEDYRIELTALTEAPITSGWLLHGNGDMNSLTIETLRAELAEGVIAGHGLIEWRDEIPRFELQGDWSGLVLTVDDELPLHAPGGEFQLSGTTAQYTVELFGDLAAGDWPAVTISLHANGTAEQLDIDALELKLLDGVLHANGLAVWDPQPKLELNITGEQLDPGRHWPDWPGRIDLSTTLAAERIDGDWRLALQDFVVLGKLRDYPLQASGNLLADADEYHIEKLAVHSGDSQLTLDGKLGATSHLDWRLHSPDLGQLWPDASGQIDGHGHLRGSLETPEIVAALSGEGISSPWLTIDTLQAELNLDVAADRFDADVEAAGLQIADQIIERLSVQSQGSLEQHNLSAELNTARQHLSLQGSGSLRDDTWTLNLEQAAVGDPMLGDWQLENRLVLSLSRTAVHVEPHCWQQQTARLCAHGDWQQASTWNTDIELTGLQLGEHIVLPDDLPLLTGAIEAKLEVQGTVLDVESVNGAVMLSAASLQPAEDIDPLRIDELTVTIADTIDGAHLQVTGTLDGVYPGEVQGELRTGKLRLTAEALAATPIDGQVKATFGDLRQLIILYTDMEARQAAATLDARIGGRIEKPEFTGTLQLTAAMVTIVEPGVELSEFELQVDGNPDGELTLNGLARSGPGKLEFDGQLQVEKAAVRIVALNINGENFETLNLPEAWVLTSPELQVEHVNDIIEVTGEVTVPEALLEPLEAAGTVTVSPDERIVTPDVDEPAADPLQIAARIRLNLGDEVRIRGPGFNGRLTGTLDIRQQPGRPATAEGMLNIVDGVYSAYGQELHITTGQLIYTGQPIDDPELNIRAVRSIGEIQAGVRAFGSARRPEAELFSTPTMPEADILSYLVTGRPVSGLGAGEGNMLMDAAVAMGLRRTEPLRQQIAGTLGLDELALTASGLDDADARLTVGKYLTPRLYVSYAAGLVETAVDTMRLRYTINRWLSLEAEQGYGTGADLLYQIER